MVNEGRSPGSTLISELSKISKFRFAVLLLFFHGYWLLGHVEEVVIESRTL